MSQPPQPAEHGPAVDAPAPVKPAWIPIRSLSERHRERALTHFLTLPPEDRYLRFGYHATDAQIGRYVDQLDFGRDELLGVFDRRLRLVAVAHLAFAPDRSQHAADAEFGVSVLPQARGRAFGTRLFEHAVLHARNRGVSTLFIHALSENTIMLRIARRAGAVVERDGAESQAHLRLPPETLASQVEQFVGDSVAELDYQLKHQAQRVGDLLEVLAEVRQRVGRTVGSTASE